MLLAGCGPALVPLPCQGFECDPEPRAHLVCAPGPPGWEDSTASKAWQETKEKAISGVADTAERGFILQDAQHTSNRGRGSSPKEKGPIIAFIKTSLGWKSFGGLSTPMGTGFPQLHRQPCSCSKAKLGKSRSRREDLGRQEKVRVCFQCRKAGEFISAM